jgi:ArsR family transcriptional regulator, arsenate/arsenite/antimonite-responsive transcriptional repressor / arsenate reductase (thioredoxin)
VQPSLIFVTPSVITESMPIEINGDVAWRASVHGALADPARLAIVDRLLLGDASPSALQLLLSMPSNLIAHHLRVLEAAGVVRRTRSEADRRRTYACLNAKALEALVPSAGRQAQRVVFVGTENSARSQLAVAIWNRYSNVPAASAGTHPAAEVHPGAVAAARRHELAMLPRTPTHLDNVVVRGDLVIAVCDNAHEELPAELPRIHWSIPDPVRTATRTAFDRAVGDLTVRIDRLVPAVKPA